MKGRVQFGISRPQGGRHDENEVVAIEFVDFASLTHFLRVEIQLADFAKALTGLHGVFAEADFNRLDLVGKTRIREDREAFYRGPEKSREQLGEWLLENHAEPGWEISTYLGSQGSVVSKDGGQVLRYSVARYVAQEEQPNPPATPDPQAQ